MKELQAASEALRHGRHKKTGDLAEAIPIIDKAITELKAGDRPAADKSITAAIDKVEKGLAAGVR